jgi:hypothetical protein
MIPIFKYEIESDIAEAVRSSGSITFAKSIKTIDIDDEQKQSLQKLLHSDAVANPNQFDLFYLESILASVGWNQNDDVFDKQEIWFARNTPVDKPFNYMHDSSDIIGHLTSSKVVDFSGNVVANETSMPDQFDIVVGSVLYRTWSNEKLQQRMNKIIDEISHGKWFVSMECLFRHFDYAIITAQGEHKVLVRDDNTSFLTKHLRVYGGTGEFDGNRVGRLLRGFTFSGKGLVDNPANPRSNITNTDDRGEISSFAGVESTAEELEISNEEIFMSNVSQEQYDALKTELEELKASKVAEAQKELDDAKAQIATLEKEQADLQNELDASREIAKAKDENIASITTEIEEIKSKLASAESKLAEQQLSAVRAARKAKLLSKVDDEKAESLVLKFDNASDELFDTLYESLPAKKADDDDDDDDDDESSAGEVDSDLNDAAASNDADMSSGGDEEGAQAKTAAAAVDWFMNNVLRSTAGIKTEGEQ